MTIPKVIYQTVSDVTKLRPEYILNREAIARVNPNWQMKLFSDDDIGDFIIDEFDEKMFSYYSKISPDYGAARADLFRYLLIYKYGGLYLDIKSSVIKSLDSVIKESDEFITSTWPLSIDGVDISLWGNHKNLTHSEYQNWFILSAPGSKILEDVITSVCANIDRYNPLRHGVGRMAVLETTGPIAYSKVVHKYVLSGKARLASNEHLGLKYTIYNIESRAHALGDPKNYRYQLTPIIYKSHFNSVIVKFYFYSTKVFAFIWKKLVTLIKYEHSK